MNVTESCHVNTLLSWALGPARGEPAPTDAAAIEAAAYLADRADACLAAGWSRADVERRWIGRPKRQLKRRA